MSATLSSPGLRIVLRSDGAGDPARALPARDDGRRLAVLSALLDRGHSVTCPDGDGPVAPHDASPLLVLAEGGGDRDAIADGGIPVSFRDIAAKDAAAVVAIVEEVRSRDAAYAPGAWKPWFPVIDYDRCTNCMQCLSFCLFDVYGVDQDKRIEVRNQDKCKTNCPACSRVCPEVAILFPKYSSGPINGDEVRKEDAEREKVKTDISALLGGDIHALLRERHARAQSRFSKERDESRALKERIKCLKKLGEDLDIPEEVLMALPSWGEIKDRAEEAFRRTTEVRTEVRTEDRTEDRTDDAERPSAR